jgi:glycosyltransferase involved in cell wall biosynthesis
MSVMPEIAWFTPPVGIGVGYGYAAVSLIQALQSLGVKVSYDNDIPLVHVSFVQPEYYSGSQDQYRIGYTPWESTVIPVSWPRQMGEMDEIWTTSTFCKEVFASYNIESTIVPHGINPEHYPISDRILADRFIFLHIGGPTERKGGQKVVNAFMKLFDNPKYPNVYLVMKSNGPSEARWYRDGRYMGNISSHPKIQSFTVPLDEEDMNKLYSAAHCMVYPTNGEGFGLIPFQGIATGLPTICTNATGCADFADLSVPLDYEWTEGEGVHLGSWVEPNFDDLCDKMMYVYENWEEVKKKTMQSAYIIQDEQNWQAIGHQVYDLLGTKMDEKARNVSP